MSEVPRTGASACIALGVSVGAYLALMLAVALVPARLAHPLVCGGTLSVGLLFGVLVIVLCISMSALYTRLRNRSRGE